MSTITVTTGDSPPVDTQTFTVTQYHQVAADLMKAFDQLAAIIPRIEEAESGVKLVRSLLNVPDAFCARVISAVEQLPELQNAKLDPAAARNKLQFLDAFRQLSDNATGFAKRLQYTLMWLKATLVDDSLQVYRIAKGHASNKRSPLVQAHVDDMKHILGRKGVTKAQRDQNKFAKDAIEAARRKEVKAA